MAQFCGDIKCEFYDTFPDGQKFPFCPFCRKPLVAEKPSLPEVTDPQPVDQTIEREESFVEIKSCPNIISNQFIPPIYNWGATRRERNIESRHDIKFEDVIVTFSTAVLKKHYLQTNGCISLRFKSSSIGEFKFERIEFKGFRQVNYEGNEFILLEETIKINKSVLAGLKHSEQLLIPYKYYFSDSEEDLYLNEGDCYRNLIISQYNFIESNNILKFDMIVLPEQLENEYYYLKQIDTRLSITFNIYVPEEKILLHLPISTIKDEVQTILFSLCNGYYSKISLLKKRKNFQVYDSKEQINSIFRYILYIWLKGLMNASSPFHSKILLSFFTFEDELIQPHSTELFILLFQGVNNDFILSLINSRCDAFSDYISEIKSRPYLLHHAMQGISSKDFSQLIKFLPLYHFLFDSKENFSIAQSNNAFLDNAYWGLPSNVKFQYYDDVDISVIRDAMSIFHTTDPLLPYSIILLALSSDIFLDLLEIRSIPYLPFFSVLLYRVKTWSLIQQDCELRELVFTTFLEKSEQTPGLMNEDHICQACDVIFRMLDVIKDSPVTLLDKLNLEQAKSILHVLAKLLELFEKNHPTFISLQHFHRAESIILSLKTAPVLLTTIKNCLYEDVLQPNFQSKCTLLDEVKNVWGALCCILFPQSYNWISAVCKQLSKRLSEQTLESILIIFVEICNHYNESNKNSIFSCFSNEILEKLRTSKTFEKDQKTTVEHIVQVSKERFYLVADIIADILSSNSTKLNENPVKHILTLPWWSRVVKFCKPNEFTQSHPDAENIMELVRSTFSNLSLQYHILALNTEYLTMVIDNQDNYFSMLHSMPEGNPHILKQLDRVFFNDSVQHRKMLRDAFMEFRVLMYDLKKLLDSTNSQIRSQELSRFLNFDFKNASISTLISEDVKTRIIPDWEHSEIINSARFKLMLRTLPYFIKSQYFLSTFKQKVFELKEYEKSLKELHLLYIGAVDTIRNTIKYLFEMEIIISTVFTHFYIDTAQDSDLFDREIDHLVSAIESFDQKSCYKKENKTESVRKVKLCFKLKQRQKLTETIIKVKNHFYMKGKFSEIDILSTLNDHEKKLQALTEETFQISDQIFQFNELDQVILDSLLICVDLFLWASSILQTQTDLENLRELALNSIDGSSFEINRISSFYTLCKLFSPFIYELNEEIDQESFLNRLSKVHHNIKSREDIQNKLADICRDCAKEANIEFWKTLELKHTSIGGNILSELKQIMSSGIVILYVKKSSCSIEDIISVQITQQVKTYSLNELKEMQSENILISSEMHQDSVGARFQHLLKLILSLSEIVLKFHKSGNVLFRKKKLAYSCDSTDILSEDITFLEEKYKNWINNFEQSRQKCYFLNFFTSSQILTIQIELERLERSPFKVIERQAFYLLTFLSEELSEEIVRGAFNRVERGSSSSIRSPIGNIDSDASDEFDVSPRVESKLSCFGPLAIDVPEPTFNNQFDNEHNLDLMALPQTHNESDQNHLFYLSRLELSKMFNDQPEYICLIKLEKLFRILSSKNDQEKRKFSLISGEPNLIFVASHLMMDSILSLYYPSKQLPYPHEVLMCSEKTTLEEIEIFWRRSLNHASNAFIFCLASIEKLNYDVAVKSVSSLKGFLNSASSNESEFRLVLICSEEHKHSSYMASALVRYERILTEIQNLENLQSFVFRIISASAHCSLNESEYFPMKPASTVDPDECYVRIVLSESQGNGKSLWITRLVEALKKLSKSEDPHETPCTIVSLYESKGCEDKTTDKLLASPVSAGEYGRIYHFDIICSSDKQLLSFLFKLLIMRTICDSSGRIYRCSKNNYYVIEANMSILTPELMHFFELFPVWKCLGPSEVLRSEKGRKYTIIEEISLRDPSEFQSEAFQRVFEYLTKLESRANIDGYIYTNYPIQKCENRLDLLLKYYGQDNPSWSEIKHFISFFNKQLIACEGNIYCQTVKFNTNWSGFKQFLVDCMVLMSKDFTTPSLRNSLQSPPPDAVAGYGIDENRKWGQKNYPNIFINKDFQSMTFFGISISQNLSKLDGFDSNRVIAEKVIPKQLYNLLKKNEVDLEEDFHNWDRHKMLSILVNVLGVPSNSSDAPPDPDPNYVLTVDNVKKILAIHMRFRSNIPVILMGDTGCGKTRLIQFMCKLQSRNPDLHNLVILKVHGEITENDIKDSYRNALELAERNSLENIDTILFFDEANTSYSIGLIKEILCDRRVDGVSIPNRLRLQFVVACNPYQRHSDKMLTKLTSAGLGMLASNDQVREHFMDIPLRELVYRVLPLPNSLLPLVWDFGNLTPESEKSYIYNIVVTNLKHYATSKQLVSYSRVISDTFYQSQMYMRNRRDECSFVSLRDVERTVRVMLWFYQWLPYLQIYNMTLDLMTYSLILALAVCYRAKLRERKEFDEYVISNVEHLRNRITEVSLITREIEKLQDVVVSMMSVGEHIAINRALKENLFMMFVCIQLKIPLFIIGKPGTSKSLAKYIISHSMNGDLTIHGKKVAGIQFTQVSMESYQCSQLTTSEEIRSLFKKCETIQAQNDPSCVACVVLDEVGLAEDSPNLPLKILHSLLEDGVDSEGQGPGVAFIGLSNWALDPAKMNRGIMLHLEDPTAEELVNTAHSIREKHDNYSQTLSPYIKSLAEGYLKLVEMPLLTNRYSKDYFGLRDFYHLVKMLYFLCKKFNVLNKRIIIYAIKKNFSGVTDINAVVIFNQYLNIPDSEDDIGPLSDPLSLITSSLESKSHEDPYLRSRYLLLLTDDYVALDILFNSHILNEDTKVMFGSSFPLDQEYFSICHNLNRIKIFMETGKTVVLTNLSNVYESLYEMLNQFYVELFGRSWVDIGIGSRRIKCAVHPDFRLIVIADKSTVFEKFPPPLINRLEKHILTISTIIEDDVVMTNIVSKLREWLQRFNTIHINVQNDTLPFMVYSTINKLRLKGRELEWEEHILKVLKFELLKIVTPNSILRFLKSDLTIEATDVYQKYCKIKPYSLADYLQEIPNIKKYFNEQYQSLPDKKSSSDVINPVFHSDLNFNTNGVIPFLSFVTTHSILLTETDISEIANNLTAHFEMKPNISLINLSQFQAEEEFIFSINQDISIKLKENEKKIIIIQCEENSKYSDLISCAKYRLVEIINENNSRLNSNFYFILIIKLVLTEPGSGCSSFCGEPWDSVYIDELRKSYHYLLPPFDQITQLSVAQIFNYHYQDIPVCYPIII